ncbi:MAG: sensor histidine kinase [Prevotella sp.]|nr:sensor histidine kinase [Prevotella sp.]
MQETFSITPRIIAHFGEDLIKNDSIAILELVKNSYDAGASHCIVDFHVENAKLESISICDDGCGMDIDTIKKVWLVIGTDNKKPSESKFGRYPLGEKGIGRLGVHKLGKNILMYTKTDKSNEVHVHIDWEKLNYAQHINDFTIDITEVDTSEYYKNGESGTTIIIRNLKSGWDRRQIREVYRNIMSLNSPFGGKSDSFNVEIRSNSNIFDGLPKFEDIISNGGLYFGRCEMSGNEIKTFKYEFKPWQSLNKIERGRTVTEATLQSEDLLLKGLHDVEGKKRKQSYDIDLNDFGIGDVVFDLIIFETDTVIFNYINTEKTSLKTYLSENGGIRVYRDNVRVYDYGEPDNDWLGIDLKRVHRVGGNVSNNIILGSVRLKREQSLGLKEKTNREGFIENESYHAFVDAINYVLSIFVRLRNEDKEKLTNLYKKHKAIEPVLSDLNDAIELVNKKVKDETDRNHILKYLYRIDKQYAEVKDVLIKSANAGLNLGVVIHEMEKQVAALVGCIERNEQERILDISKRLEKIVRGYTAMIRRTSIGQMSLSNIVKTAVENYEFRFSDHVINVYSNYEKNGLLAWLAESESVSVLTNLLDNSIFWLGYTRQEDRKISIFITDQISGYNSIIVSDNGPGFNISTDVAVQPFITGKPNNIGMGLGLHIANEMMHAMNGQLLFLDENDIELPRYAKDNRINKAIIALCFPKEKRK